MSELIAQPDVDDVMVTFFNTQLPVQTGFAGVPTQTGIPNPRPSRHVRTFVTGGGEINLVTEEALVTVESFGETEAEAAALARMNDALLKRAGRAGWLGSTACKSVRTVSRPQNLPDPLYSGIRYTALYAIRFGGAVITD